MINSSMPWFLYSVPGTNYQNSFYSEKRTHLTPPCFAFAALTLNNLIHNPSLWKPSKVKAKRLTSRPRIPHPLYTETIIIGVSKTIEEPKEDSPCLLWYNASLTTWWYQKFHSVNQKNKWVKDQKCLWGFRERQDG